MLLYGKHVDYLINYFIFKIIICMPSRIINVPTYILAAYRPKLRKPIEQDLRGGTGATRTTENLWLAARERSELTRENISGHVRKPKNRSLTVGPRSRARSQRSALIASRIEKTSYAFEFEIMKTEIMENVKSAISCCWLEDNASDMGRPLRLGKSIVWARDSYEFFSPIIDYRFKVCDTRFFFFINIYILDTRTHAIPPDLFTIDSIVILAIID